MKCPVCSDAKLVMTERQGIEIDYCPECRGVWLDRGELDKIIERAAAPAPSRAQPQRQDERGSRHHEHDHDHYRKKKRSSLLGDLFDF